MNELELFKKLIEVERNAHDLDLHIQIWTNEKEKAEFEVEYDKCMAEIEVLKNQLLEVEDKTPSREAKESMVRQLGHYVEQINKTRPGVYLSRNQDLISGNELFVGIVRDLTYAMTSKILRIPMYLVFTNNIEDAVEISDVTGFLETEIERLHKIDSINYLKLRNFKDGFTERLIQQFIQ